ncbi:MAG: PH domain-containing protein [Fimbriimonadaceae bacterium]|nr:PH domain-containing protein [Fimbriimonadaceae bacterium]
MNGELAIRTTEGPRPIHPGIRKVWLFSNSMTFLILAIVASGGEYLFVRQDLVPWSFPLLAPIFFLSLWAFSAFMVKRQWENWTYEVTPTEIILSWGVLWQTKRFVPRDRVQHVDVNSGPLDRRFGLVQVSLFVAGAMGSVGSIPGLKPEEADELRDMLVESQAKHV